MEMWSKRACLACVLSSSAETILPENPLRDCKKAFKVTNAARRLGPFTPRNKTAFAIVLLKNILFPKRKIHFDYGLINTTAPDGTERPHVKTEASGTL
ncbi:hypothetical protein CDAR_368061 [Caerostris darwini]|uniref:Secreted protein n=1 Tax=Caerostris darwini TaxID=1538125 RepID=A0AAV4UHM4_9ARAC|nr:hypothetical protein CDAR_368061 [Caerostris darwini]